MGRAERIEYAAGFGFADVARRIPFSPDTPTDGASIAKTFTAAALLRLASDGKVDLETRVREILPEYPHATTRIRHLLAHSAGLPGYEWLDSRVAAGAPRTNASHLAVVRREAPAPAFTPGTAFSYDNVAYDVLAMVIERITGRSYRAVVAEYFTTPLGMQAFVRPARFADWKGTRTRGYQRTARGLVAYDAFELEGFHGAANIYLSAHDLQKWAAGHRRAVGAATSRQAVAPSRLDDGRTTGISLGSWYVADSGARRYYTGHHNGFFNVAYVDDARALSVAWVANDAPAPWLQPALTRALIAIAEGRTPERLVPPTPSATLSDVSGRYHVPSIGAVLVRQQGTHVIVRVRSVDYEAFDVGDTTFYIPGADAYVRFAPTRGNGVSMSWSAVFAVARDVLRASR